MSAMRTILSRSATASQAPPFRATSCQHPPNHEHSEPPLRKEAVESGKLQLQLSYMKRS